MSRLLAFLLCLIASPVLAQHATVTIPSTVVTGPASATSGNCASYNGTTGKIIQDAGTTCGGGSVIRGYINGFTLSNDGGTPNSVLDIAAGFAADSTNAVSITGTAFTKSTAGVWAAGTGNNGMGQGLTIANTTWYHVFAIINAGNFDVYFDTSVTAANKPASTTAFRRIGSFLTNGSAQIIAFSQRGQSFFWAVVVTDLSTASPATVLTNVALSVPLGVVTLPVFTASSSPAAAGNAISFSSAGHSGVDTFLTASGSGNYSGPITVLFTNTSSQIQYKATSNTDTVQIRTSGWIDPAVASIQ